MITAPLINQGVKVDLPQASSEPVPPSDAPPVIVSVDAAGQFYIDYDNERAEPLDRDALTARVTALLHFKPGSQVLVNGDRHVEYARVVELMALLQAAGVPSVGLMTEPPPTIAQ